VHIEVDTTYYYNLATQSLNLVYKLGEENFIFKSMVDDFP